MTFARIFLAAIAFSCVTLCLSADTCKEKMVDVDRCYTSVHVIGDTAFSRPKNLAEVDSHCKKMKESLKCVKEYGKCMGPLPKTMYSVLYSGLKKETSSRCKSETSRKEFITMSEKIKDVKPQYDGVFFKLRNFYNWATLNITKEDQLQYICCGYQYILPDMYKTAKDLSGEKTAKYLDKAIKNLWGDIIDFACGKYKDPATCDRQLPGSRDLYNRQNRTGNSGILIPLIRYANTLD